MTPFEINILKLYLFKVSIFQLFHFILKFKLVIFFLISYNSLNLLTHIYEIGMKLKN